MDKTTTTEVSQSLIELRSQTLLQVALLGAGLGVVSWLLTLLVRHIIFIPLFCGDPANAMCVGATGGAGVIALIATGIAGLLGLVRLGVYRPLLVALAAAVTLWGMSVWIGSLYWFEALLWSAVLYVLAYVVFTWLVRPRNFGFAIVLVAIVVLLARIVTIL